MDTIGVDSYDMWPGATSAANWQKQLNGTQGLNYWLAFAIAHGKKFAVPEWGNVTPGTVARSSGGDNPAYVNDMRGFFQANAANLAWESNFQGTAVGGNYGTGGTTGLTHQCPMPQRPTRQDSEPGPGWLPGAQYEATAMIIIAVASGLSRPDSTSSKRVSYAPRDMLATPPTARGRSFAATSTSSDVHTLIANDAQHPGRPEIAPAHVH